MFKGNVTTSSSTNLDISFADSSGDFATTTGDSTVGGNLAVTGTTEMNGAVTLGDAKADTIAFKGDVAADAVIACEGINTIAARGVAAVLPPQT